MARVKIHLEYLFRASPTILYTFFTQPACLVRWFCDKVDITGDFYMFYWGSIYEIAYMEDDIQDERIRFRWESADDPNEYLEISWRESPITEETIMEIVDFCDADETGDQKKYWDNLIQNLRRETGS